MSQKSIRYHRANHSKRRNAVDVAVANVFDALRGEFVLVGKANVKVWHAWLVLGLVVGIVAGIVSVASRSGDIESGYAAVISSLRVTAPNGGEAWPAGSTQSIRWQGGRRSDRIAIALKNLPTATGVPLAGAGSSDAFEAGTVTFGVKDILAVVPNTGAYSWSIATSTEPGQYLIKICIVRTVTGGFRCVRGTADRSNAPFTITTIPAVSLDVSLASEPGQADIIAGSTGIEFARPILSATSSSEAVVVTSAQFRLETDVGDAFPSNCRVFDGATALNTGTNIVNTFADGVYTFTFDSRPVVPAGAEKRLSLRCDVPTNAEDGSTIEWRLNASDIIGAVGVDSGRVAVVRIQSSPDNQNRMTVRRGGLLSVALDSSSPALRLVQAGTEQTVAVVRLAATDEAVQMSQIAFKISGEGEAIPANLVKISLWDGATKVGEVVATSSETGYLMRTDGLIVPRDGDKVLRVVAQLADIGNNQPGRPGDRIAVNWDQVNVNGKPATFGVGLLSGAVVYASGDDTRSEGVRMFRAFPTLAQLPVPSTSLADASQKTLYRFSLSSQAGTNGASLYKFVYKISTTSDEGTANDFTISNYRLYAFTDSNFTIPAYSPDGQLNNGGLFRSGGIPDGGGGCSGGPLGLTCSVDLAFYFNPANPTSTTPEAIAVQSGTSYYFELRGDVTGADAGDSATVSLQGDASYGGISTPQQVDLFVDDDLIWSGNSTTTHSGASGASGPDWSNGHLVPGLPAEGMTAVVFTL